MVTDEDQDRVDKKREEKIKYVYRPLVSYQISDEEEIETIFI